MGIFFGFLTAYWGMVIDWCVEFVWETVPEVLLEWGWFTDLDGPRPLPHYFWVCPTVFGAVSSICPTRANYSGPVLARSLHWLLVFFLNISFLEILSKFSPSPDRFLHGSQS